ncbi:hypothetical protein [Sphaerisporangium aureirubrum]|uniref:Uncharacterized protein n=1 Tax=Sphaerisporangium aureirubrum TaxID=1544736 RepID=A0ABW1NPE5_9ACTN
MTRPQQATAYSGLHEKVRQDAATRNLCAGVYVDRAFRDLVIRRVYCDVKHRVAPAYGFELIPVVRHAWWAWTLDAARYVTLVAVFVIGFSSNTPAAVVTVSGLVACCLARVLLHNTRALLPLKARAVRNSLLRQPRWNSEVARLREHTRLAQISMWACLALLVVPLVVAWVTGVPLTEVMRQAGTLAVLAAMVTAGSEAVRQLLIDTLDRPVEPDTESVLGGRLKAIHHQEQHPLVVYPRTRPVAPDDPVAPVMLAEDDGKADDPTLFFGSGKLVHRWKPPLVVRLVQRDQNMTGESWEIVPPFPAHELVDHLRETIRGLRRIEGPTRLRGLEVHDRLYVAEEDVAGDRAWLRDEPTPGDIDGIIDAHFTMVHHFLEIRVSDTGEVVTTVFLRVTIKGRALSLDFAACALTRTPVEYQMLNAFTPSGAGGVIRSALRGAWELPRTLISSWRVVEVPLMLFRVARVGHAQRRSRGATVGPRLSIRQLKTTKWNEARLDHFTIQDHIKIIEQHLLKAAEEFLSDKGLDTSAFKTQATTIINSGVLNMGGKTEVNQSTVGTNSELRLDTRVGDGEN